MISNAEMNAIFDIVAVVMIVVVDVVLFFPDCIF